MRVRFLVATLIFSLVVPEFLAAQAPVVSSSELHQAIAAAMQTRQKNLEDVRGFFGTDRVRAALKTGKVDYQKVDQAVATLSPDELARLASRTNQLEKDFAGGALTNQQLTYIVIALATAVIVLIAVKD
jgi:hypothetical protein